jgi:hypothetical protein
LVGDIAPGDDRQSFLLRFGSAEFPH